MTREEIINRLETISKHAIHTVGEEAYVMSLDDGIALRKAIKALKAQRWIPVSEDKPEPFQEVLVTLHENGWNGETYDTVKSQAYDGDYKITAWMPLPQPYKENEE